MAKVPKEKADRSRMDKIGRLTEEATVYLERNEGRYKEILSDIVLTLEQLSSGDGRTVQGRVKSAKSLREKILRKGYYTKYDKGEDIIDELPDLIGVRIQCLLNRDERRAYENLWDKKTKQDAAGYAIYRTKRGSEIALLLRNQPEKQKNGNDIYRIEGKYYPDSTQNNAVHFELQIKSMVHLFWGELEHSMFYKNYDSFVSQKVLAQSMDNILAELELIDKEMDGLKNHFSRSRADRINEFKSVCISVIQNEYQDKFDKLYGCQIDLRPAYWLIVQMNFNRILMEEDAALRLSKMIQQCKKMNLEEAQRMAQEKLEIGRISPENKSCAEWLDELIKRNIYWEAFFCIYSTIKQEDEFHYGDWVGDIAMRLQRLVILNEFTEDFTVEDSAAEEFKQKILLALILGSGGKPEYFMDERRLHFLQEKISEALRGSVFEKYVKGCGQEQFNHKEALESVFLWTGCLIDFHVNGCFVYKKMEELKMCMDKENIFPADIEWEQTLESFCGAERLTGQAAEKLYQKLCVWESEGKESDYQ